MQPANRVGRYLIFPNGGVMKISPLDRLLYKLGVKKTAVYRPPKGVWRYPWQ